MQMFEYPFIAISVLIVCFCLLGGVVIYYAARGLRNERDDEDTRFENIKKLENSFTKAGKLRENRCVLYVNVFLDDFRSLYFQEKTETVYTAIKHILLQYFSSSASSMISAYGDCAYVVFTTQDVAGVKSRADDFYAALNKRLAMSNALNVIDVTIGIFSALGTDISFDDAINRAQKACILAKNEKLPFESSASVGEG